MTSMTFWGESANEKDHAKFTSGHGTRPSPLFEDAPRGRGCFSEWGALRPRNASSGSILRTPFAAGGGGHETRPRVESAACVSRPGQSFWFFFFFFKKKKKNLDATTRFVAECTFLGGVPAGHGTRPWVESEHGVCGRVFFFLWVFFFGLWSSLSPERGIFLGKPPKTKKNNQHSQPLDRGFGGLGGLFWVCGVLRTPRCGHGTRPSPRFGDAFRRRVWSLSFCFCLVFVWTLPLVLREAQGLGE